jgi:hypothetical protein
MRCEDIVASHGTPPPNQAMERTATRPVFTFKIIKPFSLRATLALVAVAHLVLVSMRRHQLRAFTDAWSSIVRMSGES